MSNPKNKGTKLFFSQYGGEQPIPPEFIAAMNRTEEIQPVPNDVTPETLSDTIVESKVETNRTNERVRKTVKKAAGNIGPLHFIHVNDQGKPVQVSRTLIPTAYAVTNASIPTATSTPADQDLGNGWTIREVAVEGTYVAGTFTPGVFPANVFERERPNLVPEEFRPAIPTVTTRVDSAGTAVDPTLSGTELSERQEQITDLKKRITIATQAAPSLPVTLDKGRDTNQEKQDVTVTRILETDATTAPTATALKDVSVKQLGDGNKVVETREVASVFGAEVYRRDRPNLIPEEFRPAIPTVTTRVDSSGAAADPTLSGTELSETQSQVTAFTKRIEISTQAAPSLPVTLDKGRDTNQAKQDVTVTRKLIADATTADIATALKDVSVKQLGDGNKVQETREISAVFDAKVFAKERPDNIPERFKATIPAVTERHVVTGTAAAPALSTGDIAKSERQQDSFNKETSVTNRDVSSLPTLEGQTYDESLDVVIPYTETIDTAGTNAGNARTDVTPLGGGLELAKEIDATALAAVLDAYMLEFPGTANISFPDELISIDAVWEKSSGNGDYNEDGSAIAVNSGWSMSPRGSGQASAAIIPSLAINTRQKWGHNLATTHYFFYLPSPVDTADVLGKIGAVSAWPDFNPQSHTIVCTGQRLSLRVDANVQRSEYDNGDGVSSAMHSEGDGASREVGVTVNTVHIPPTIHGSISVTGVATDTQDLSASAHADTDGYSADRTEEGTVTGTISPATLNATAGDTTIPSGTYLLDTHCEPAGRLNYVRVHAETVEL